MRSPRFVRPANESFRFWIIWEILPPPQVFQDSKPSRRVDLPNPIGPHVGFRIICRSFCRIKCRGFSRIICHTLQPYLVPGAQQSVQGGVVNIKGCSYLPDRLTVAQKSLSHLQLSFSHLRWPPKFYAPVFGCLSA